MFHRFSGLWGQNIKFCNLQRTKTVKIRYYFGSFDLFPRKFSPLLRSQPKFLRNIKFELKKIKVQNLGPEDEVIIDLNLAKEANFLFSQIVHNFGCHIKFLATSAICYDKAIQPTFYGKIGQNFQFIEVLPGM